MLHPDSYSHPLHNDTTKYVMFAFDFGKEEPTSVKLPFNLAQFINATEEILTPEIPEEFWDDAELKMTDEGKINNRCEKCGRHL